MSIPNEYRNWIVKLKNQDKIILEKEEFLDLTAVIKEGKGAGLYIRGNGNVINIAEIVHIKGVENTY